MNKRLLDTLRSIKLSQILEKTAEYFENDTTLCAQLTMAKVALDSEIFGMSKHAIDWSQLANLGKKVGTGAAVGAGAAIPATLAGHYLIGRTGEEARETTADTRNKVLQAALGIAGMGAGLYGLHRLSGGGPLLAGLTGGEEKQAADETVLLEEAFEKLATVGVLDAIFAKLTGLTKEAQVVADQIRVLNRSYGVQLLHELAHG